MKVLYKWMLCAVVLLAANIAEAQRQPGTTNIVIKHNTCPSSSSSTTPSNGHIDLNYLGYGTVSYKWDANTNNATTPSVSNLAPGAYSVTITDKPFLRKAIITYISIEVGYQVIWTGTSHNIGYSYTPDNIQKSDNDFSYGSSGGFSANVLPPASVGEFSFEIGKPTYEFAVGFSDADNGRSPAAIGYSMRFDGSGGNIIFEKKGYAIANANLTLHEGDRFRIIKYNEPGKAEWYIYFQKVDPGTHNVISTLFRTQLSQAEIQQPAFIDIAFKTAYATVDDIYSTFPCPFPPGYIIAPANISNISCVTNSTTDAGDGAITLDPQGGGALAAGQARVYSYLWSTGAKTKDIIGLDVGNYQVTVTDNSYFSVPFKSSFDVNYNVLWKNQQKVNTTKTSIVKNGTSNTYDLAGAVSDNKIPVQMTETGWFQFQLQNANDELAIGFSQSNFDNTPANIEWSMRFVTSPSHQIIIEKKGLQQTAIPFDPQYVYRIEKSGNDIGFYRVNHLTKSAIIVLHGIAADFANGVRLCAAFKTPNGGIISSSTNIPCDYKPVNIDISAIVKHVSCLAAPVYGAVNGSITLTPSGGGKLLFGQGPRVYSYLWSNTAITKDINGLAMGPYSVTVRDNSAYSNPTTKSYTIGLGLLWTDLVGVTIANNSIQKNSTSGYGTSGAASDNLLLAGATGWVEFQLQNATDQFAIGFSYLNQDENYTSIDCGMRFAQNSQIRFEKKGVAQSAPAETYAKDDIFRITKSGNGTIAFSKRASGATFPTLLYTTTIPDGNLVVDLALSTPYAQLYNIATNIPCRNISQYGIVKKTLDAGYYKTAEKKIRFIFEEEYIDGQLAFNVYQDGNMNTAVSTNSLTKKYGTNYFEVNSLSSLSQGMYVLEVITEKNDKYYLRFKI